MALVLPKKTSLLSSNALSQAILRLAEKKGLIPDNYSLGVGQTIQKAHTDVLRLLGRNRKSSIDFFAALQSELGTSTSNDVQNVFGLSSFINRRDYRLHRLHVLEAEIKSDVVGSVSKLSWIIAAALVSEGRANIGDVLLEGGLLCVDSDEKLNLGIIDPALLYGLLSVHPNLFNGRDLQGSNLTSMDLSCTDLRSANLSYSVLDRTDLSSSDLTNANMSYVTSSESARDKIFVAFTLDGSICHRTNFTGAQLCHMDGYEVDFTGALFIEALLKWPDLRHSRFNRADFQDASLCGPLTYGSNLGKAGRRLSKAEKEEIRIYSSCEVPSEIPDFRRF